SHVIVAVAAVIEAEVVVEVIRILIVLHILAAAVVEQAMAAAAGVVAGRRRPSDVVEAGLTGKLASGGPTAPRGRSTRAGRGVEGGMCPLRVFHHGANAAEQQRAADHAGGGRGGGAEKRAARRRGRSHRRGRHRLHWLGCGMPGRRHGRSLVRPHRGHRAAALTPAEDALAYSAEEALIARRWVGGRTALELTNTSVGPFEGFVLHQYGLDQRVDGVGGLPQAIPDKPFGLGIALGILLRGQAVEQFDDEIAFLWSHWSPPSSLRRESCRQMPVKAN